MFTFIRVFSKPYFILKAETKLLVNNYDYDLFKRS